MKTNPIGNGRRGRDWLGWLAFTFCLGVNLAVQVMIKEATLLSAAFGAIALGAAAWLAWRAYHARPNE